MSSLRQWRYIAWNGISLEVPACWQPKVILATYMQFENGERPVFSIKWQPAGGPPAAARIRKNIVRHLPPATRLETWHLPQELGEKLGSEVVTTFAYTAETGKHHGLVLYCPACRTTALLQFHDLPAAGQQTVVHLLESFEDHQPDGPRQWSVFDFSALLPADAILRSHEFLPGRYTLRFGLDAMNISLYRYKPAAILLTGSSLAELGGQLANCGTPVEEGGKIVTWHRHAQGIARLKAWMRRRPSWCWMRLHHVPEHNAILGVRAEGRKFCDRRQLEKICRHFRSLRAE